MNNLNWDDIRYFLAAARAGSLAGASRALDGHQPTVGRRIAALERHLGHKLFQRHAQGLTLTDEGVNLLASAERMDEAAAALLRASGIPGGEIRGRVRIAAPSGLAVQVIAPALPDLQARYPELDVVLQAATASADLVHGEADIALRLYRPDAADLVLRRVGGMGFGLYGGASYFARNGLPADATALKSHAFIGYSEGLRHLEENQWLETLVGEARFPLRSDDTQTRIAASVAGIGLAVLPHVLASRVTGLNRVLPELEAPGKTIWLVMHQDLRHLARVRVVLDWLAEQLCTLE